MPRQDVCVRTEVMAIEALRPVRKIGKTRVKCKYVILLTRYSPSKREPKRPKILILCPPGTHES